jgi:hypothetical protein
VKCLVFLIVHFLRENRIEIILKYFFLFFFVFVFSSRRTRIRAIYVYVYTDKYKIKKSLILKK